MFNFKPLKERLDWLAHGKLLVDLAVAVGFGKVLKNMLGQFHKLPEAWISPLAWFGGALALWLMIRFVKWKSDRNASLQGQLVATMKPLLARNSSHTLAPNFDINEFFRLAHVGPISQEVENNMRFVAHRESPTDVESFYLKFIGIGLVQAINDDIWWRMFRSQLEALIEINRNGGILPLSKVKVFYDAAAKEYPNEYVHDSFERWLSYLVSNILLIRHPSDMVEITVKGRDFLKYLTHWGREPKDKRL